MTQWILKFFVKDYRHTERAEVRAAIGKTAGGVGVFVNLLLSLLKILTGALLLGGSVSVIADGVNNLSDAASGLISFWGFKLSEKPADAEHPYGHGRYEYLSGLMVALFIMVIGFELLKGSVEKIFSPEKTEFHYAVVLVLVLSVLLKFWLMGFNKNLAKRISSDTLRAASADSRNDVISTLAVLVCALLGNFTPFDPDGYVGAAVALFILYSGFRLVRSTVDPLLGKAPSPEFVEHIHTKILSYDEVLGTHDLMVHDYGPGRQFASVHLELSSQTDPLEAHGIIDRIERDFWEEEGLHLTIHYDPIALDNSALGTFCSWLSEEAKKIHPSLSVHDVRMVPCATHTNVIFDCVIPLCAKMDDQQVRSALTKTIRENYPAFLPVIHIDHSYVSSSGTLNP